MEVCLLSLNRGELTDSVVKWAFIKVIFLLDTHFARALSLHIKCLVIEEERAKV